jgi:hypothetical protein
MDHGGNSRMKRPILLFLLFLMSCAPVHTSTPTPISAISIQSLRNDYPPSINAFDISEQCPHICWLSINPGITSAQQAHTLLRASDQIDQSIFHASEDGIETNWFLEKTKTFDSYVDVSSMEGIVESISFDGLSPFILNDFIGLIGEPDEISIRVNRAADAEFVSYMVYYTTKKTRIWVLAGSYTGPDPDDRIEMLVLSTEFNTLSPSWLADYDNYRQPWLGYGHFKDYLPGVATPVNNSPIP